MGSLKEKFDRFMQGRYGVDNLSKFTLIASLVLVVLSAVLGRIRILSSIFDILGIAGIVITYYRMLSRDYNRRIAENQKYLEQIGRVKNFFNRQRSMANQRKDYRIFACPSCRQKIRIPKGKGQVEITCPKCHEKFLKRT